MRFISGFGIISAARIAALALLAMSASQAAVAQTEAPGITIDMTIKGLRSMKGNVLVCLVTSGKYFPDCGQDPNAHKLKVPSNEAAHLQFTGIKPGSYGITVLHDENGNGRMDRTLFLPKEGFALSRNPRIFFGPPSYSGVQFSVGATDVKMRLDMKYYL